MPKKNDIISIEIIDMTHEGSGVAKLDGMAIFVPNTAVGDIAEVRIVKVNKSHCYGRLEKLIQPSADRISSNCDVGNRCGGCVFRHVNYAAELRYKQQFVDQNMHRIGGVTLAGEPILPSPQSDNYRNKAQYPVRLQKDTLCAGFFAPRSHEVINCTKCSLQPSLFGDVLETILDFCRKEEVSIYNEIKHQGLLRHIYLRQATHSGELMVCLVCNGTAFPKSDLLAELLQETAPNLVSLSLNCNQEKTNVILREKTISLWGKSTIEDTMCGLKFSLSPESFYQVNTLAAEQLYALALDFAAPNGSEILLDLYCGAGTLGLSMAHRVKEVIGVEIIPQAVENAIANAAANKLSNARFLCADAGEAASHLAKEGVCPDIVVVDPPRKGCDEATLQAIAKMSPQKLIYISCNSATLARDCAILATLGFEVERYRPADFFPRTSHVETVCLLSKLKSNHHI